MRAPVARVHRPRRLALLSAGGAAALVALTLTGGAPAASAAVASYAIVHAPHSLTGWNDAGEPSVGANWSTGNLLYQSGLRTYKISPSDGWTDVSSTLTSATSLDPILFTDRRTNRTFVSQLSADCSLLAFTDNDGASWTQNPVGCGLAAGADHQTVGGGPFAAGATGTGVGYPDATYYCAQAVATAQCSLSNNGGVSFNPAVPIYNATQCGGLHGHIQVAPDGAAYVPNADCGGRQGFSVSRDNGTTWTVKTVTGSATQDESDPAIGIGSAGTVYFGFQQASTAKGVNETYPAVSVYKPGTGTFSAPVNVGTALGIRNVQFPRVVAGDDDRAAFAFLGTTTGGDDQASSFPGVWHLYISTTIDGGTTWDTVQATPNSDPVQKGCIWLGGGSNTCRNLLDFMGSTVQKDGSVVIGYADGCDSTCAGGGKNSYGAEATIARQTGGPLLFAGAAPSSPSPSASASPSPSPSASASPSPSPSASASASPTSSPSASPTPAPVTPPGAPTALTAKTRKPGGGITLTWQAPASDGGSAITDYYVYRGTSAATETLLGSTGGPTTTYKDTAVRAGTTYFYYVKAANSAGTGPASNEASATAK